MSFNKRKKICSDIIEETALYTYTRMKTRMINKLKKIDHERKSFDYLIIQDPVLFDPERSILFCVRNLSIDLWIVFLDL